MKNKLFLIALMSLLLSGCVFSKKPTPTTNDVADVACTQEAKICPDGSSVGRTAPNCEFATCPVEKVVTDATDAEDIKQAFIKKYPKYADTLTVKVEQKAPIHARGLVSFVSGEPGGIFLATRMDGVWQIMFNGNGSIPCNLSIYNFPAEMLKDCAKK